MEDLLILLILRHKSIIRNFVQPDRRLRIPRQQPYSHPLIRLQAPPSTQCLLPKEPKQRRLTALGSLTKMYFPSGCFSTKSAMVRTIPHPLVRETFICRAKSRGLYDWTPTMTCRWASRGLAREIYLCLLALCSRNSNSYGKDKDREGRGRRLD